MAINKAKELAGAGNYPANRLNKRERKALQVASSYAPANPAAWGSTPPTTVDAALDLVSSAGVAKSLSATWDFSVNGGAAGSVPLTVILPNKAIIVEAYLDVLTAVTGAGNVSFTVPVDGALHTGTISSATPVGPSINSLATPKKLTADRIVQATIATGVTAGKIQLFVRYLIGQ